jgi:hypothetical protein
MSRIRVGRHSVRKLTVKLKEKYEKCKEKFKKYSDKYRSLKDSAAEKTTFEDEEANEHAVPRNNHWNSLRLGNMYDSLFTFKVDTPHVRPDPLVWDVICAAVPPDYSIPDPEFTNELTRNVALGLLKPAPSRSLSYDDFLESFRDVSENAPTQGPGQTREQ